MKSRYLILIFIFTWLSSHSQNEFVQLKDKHFYLNEEYWYPLSSEYCCEIFCNYDPDLVTNPYLEDYWIGKWSSWRKTDPYSTECPACPTKLVCLDEIRKDIVNLKTQGFNCIRLHSPCIERVDESTSQVYIKIVNLFNCDIFYLPASSAFYPILFPLFEDVLNMVKEAGLTTPDPVDFKVLFMIADAKVINNNVQNAYLAYLAALADHFKDNTTIFAWDMVNEPSWNYYHAIEPKEDNCFKIHSWYTTIKSNDPNHLVTMGVWDPKNEIPYFDAEIMPVDFIHFHLYAEEPKEFAKYDLFNTTEKAINKVNNDIYWIYRYIDKPWMIGEIGLPGNFGPKEKRLFSFSEQAAFSMATINRTNCCNGKGYNWFLYKDGGDPYEFPVDGYGLVQYYTNKNKTAFNALANYSKSYLQSHVPPSNYCQDCDEYSNFYNYLEYTFKALSGTIKDSDGNFVEGALVIAYINYGTHTTPYYTYSRNDGSYIIYCKDNPTQIEDVICSAPGLGRSKLYSGSQSFPQNYDFSLNTLCIKVIEKLNTHAPITTGTYEFLAYRKIEISNLQVTAQTQPYPSVVFKAQNSINVKHESHFAYGTNVHFQIGNIITNCCSTKGQ